MVEEKKRKKGRRVEGDGQCVDSRSEGMLMVGVIVGEDVSGLKNKQMDHLDSSVVVSWWW